MSRASLQITALGVPILTKQLTCTAATNFTYQQAQVVSFDPALITGQTMSISLAIMPSDFQAVQLYGYEDIPKGYITFNQLFSVNPQTTAGLLGAQIHAAYPLLTASVISNKLVISTGTNWGLQFNFKTLRYLTATLITEAFDLVTYNGQALLQATVTGGDLRYSENPVAGISPTSSVGLFVAENSPFDVVGNNAIKNCQFIETGGTSLVDYTIYI